MAQYSPKEEMTIYAPMHAPVLPDGAQVIEREGWYQVITPNFRMGADNQVIMSHLQESEIDQRIEETFLSYDRCKISFKWTLGPASSPIALADKLKKMATHVVDFQGMTVETTAKISVPEDITVELVTPKNFQEFIDITVSAWEMKDHLQTTVDKYWKIIHHPKCRFFIARKNGVAIGSAGTSLKKDCGYLVGGVIAKEHRGAGAYRALVQKRLEDLKAYGYQHATTHAKSSTSAPILTKLGFETVFHGESCHFIRS
jgi:hypothetical protein